MAVVNETWLLTRQNNRRLITFERLVLRNMCNSSCNPLLQTYKKEKTNKNLTVKKGQESVGL